MEQPIYTYTFSKSDHDDVQGNFFERDIFGTSSWKGEEQIILYPSKIQILTEGQIREEYPIEDLTGFISIDKYAPHSSFSKYWSEIFISIIPERKTTYQRYIRSVLRGPQMVQIPHYFFDGAIKLKIFKPKTQEFVQALSKVLPEITKDTFRKIANEKYQTQQGFSDFPKKLMAAFVFVIIIPIIIMFIFSLGS